MSMVERSPLAPAETARMPSVSGMRLGAIETNVKYQDRDDLMLCIFDPGTSVAGVLTQSGTAGAAVEWCREALKSGEAGALVVNSGNANTFTGETGVGHVRDICGAVAHAVGCSAGSVFIASTGVIGEPLPIRKILDNISPLHADLSPDRWQQAAEAIMTTDTFVKIATASTRIGDVDVVINGMAKGSGMIEPDMATMLSFLATDAALPADVLQSLLVEANEQSFNSITVDSDTSTSDTCLLFATGQADNPQVSSPDDGLLSEFRAALGDLMRDLAQQVVRDGEGASKFIAIKVTGAADNAAAKRIAKCIANSPLVKTAIAGEDANWGRVVMAVGKSGEAYSASDLVVAFGGIQITADGARRADYDEAAVTAHLEQAEIDLDIDLGAGDGTATVWTCDLTHGYIAINADYRS